MLNLLGKDKISFLVPFLASGLGLNFLYNYALFKNPLRFPQELYINGIHFYYSGLASHVLFNLVSPYRGILLYSPILILGFYGLYRLSQSTGFRADAFLFLTLFAAILLFYSSWQGWDGGNSYGPRFLILGIPYLVIPVSVFLSENRNRIWRSIFLSLFVFSSFIQGIGAISNSSAPSSQDVFNYVPLSYSLSQVVQGKFAVWWSQWFGLSGLPTVEIALASIFVLIWITAFWLSFGSIKDRPIKNSGKAEHVLSQDVE